jgi:hypothetical protein
MNIKRVLFLCSVAALPQLAMAGTSSPQALGTVHAILDFCTEVDPRDAASFAAMWRNVSTGQSVGGSAYQQSYTLVSNELGQTSRQTSAQTCATGAKSFPVSKGRDDVHRTSGVEKRP